MGMKAIVMSLNQDIKNIEVMKLQQRQEVLSKQIKKNTAFVKQKLKQLKKKQNNKNIDKKIKKNNKKNKKKKKKVENE